MPRRPHHQGRHAGDDEADHGLDPDVALDAVLDSREDGHGLGLAGLEQLVQLVLEALPRGEHEAEIDQDEDETLEDMTHAGRGDAEVLSRVHLFEELVDGRRRRQAELVRPHLAAAG